MSIIEAFFTIIVAASTTLATISVYRYAYSGGKLSRRRRRECDNDNGNEYIHNQLWDLNTRFIHMEVEHKKVKKQLKELRNETRTK